MKRLATLSVLLLCSVLAHATAYTVTAPPIVMYVGDQTPPCETVVKTGSTVANAGSTIWTAPPTCTVPTGSLGTPGTYTITVTAGMLLSGGDSATYTNGTITVLAAVSNPSEAQLVNAFIPNNGSTAPPSGWFTSLPWAVIEATSNSICNMSASASDNSDCYQHIIAATRGAQTATVKCSGTTVTSSAGTPFTGILTSDGNVNINGVWFTPASYTDATHMVLTTTPAASVCSTASVTIYLPRTIVAVTSGSSTITWVSGPQFSNLTIANELLILGFQSSVAKIATLVSATQITLNSGFSIPNVTGNVPLYVGTLTSGGGAGGEPLFIHIPCGQFKIAHAIQSFGAYYKTWGNGQCSELYLPPNSSDFQSSTLSFLAINPVNSNDTFDTYIHNLWIHIGVGNPKAIPLTYAPSNYGALRNILISSDDGACVEGLNLGKQYTGPGFVKNVAIYGCAIGVSSSIPDHEMTLEYMTISGQTGFGVSNTNMRMQLRKALYVEPSTALTIFNTATKGNLTLMDSDIYANGAAACIQNSTTSGFPTSFIYAKNLSVHGSCTTTINDYQSGTLVPTTGDITEYWSGTAQSLFDSGSSAHSLTTPATQETPQPTDPALSTWCALGSDITTWQATINGCASTTVYTPPAQYGGSGQVNITIPDSINHFQGFNAMDTPGATYHIIFTVAGVSTTPLIFEGCPQAQCGIIHTGTRTVTIVDDNTYYYNSSPGAGNVFVEDAILGGSTLGVGDSSVIFQASQNVWARAWNQEQPTAQKIICLGGTIWVNGIKTEHNGTNFVLKSGCQVNIYGFDALGDPSIQGAGGNIVQMTDASLFMTGMMSTQCTITGSPPCNNAFYDWTQETRTVTTLSLPIPLATTVGSSQSLIGPYYAYGAAAPAATVSFQFQGAKIQGAKIQ